MNDQAIQQSDGLVSLPAIIDMAETYKLSPKAFAFTFRSVAMPQPHTEAEFVSCCLVAAEHGLNPLTKEIYFMRDKTGAIQAIVGVDGWIKKCNEHPQFDGVEFEDQKDDKGRVNAITCRIYRKDRSRPVVTTEYMAECLQQRSKPGPWQSHPNRMLRHRSLIQCARIAFGFAGVMDRDEFDQWQAMKDVTPPKTSGADLAIPDFSAPVEAEAPQESPADDEKMAPDQEAEFISHFTDQLADCTTQTERDTLIEDYDEMIQRLSDKGQREIQRIYEGRE